METDVTHQKSTTNMLGRMPERIEHEEFQYIFEFKERKVIRCLRPFGYIPRGSASQKIGLIPQWFVRSC